MTELDNIKTPIQKPFLKWIGGKGQILDKIISLIPKKNGKKTTMNYF